MPPFSLRPVGDVGAGGSFAGQPGGPPGSPYDLHSSSSSSEQPDESFLLPGANPEPTDPFSRFWGMLENMLEEISMPTALTTAPLDIPPLQAGPSRSRWRKSKSNKGEHQCGLWVLWKIARKWSGPLLPFLSRTEESTPVQQRLPVSNTAPAVMINLLLVKDANARN